MEKKMFQVWIHLQGTAYEIQTQIYGDLSIFIEVALGKWI